MKKHPDVDAFHLRRDFGRNPDAEPYCLLALFVQLLLK